MYRETWKFYKVVFSSVILWCCIIRAIGDTDINADSNSNGNIGNESLNLNITLNSSNSNTNVTVRDDYTLAEGIGYHKVHKTKHNWNDARQACIAENADLAVINSVEEKEALSQLMTNRGVSKAFVGVHNVAEKGWVTITGESLEKAGYDELFLYGSRYVVANTKCAALSEVQGMSNWLCDTKTNYICEIPL